MTTTPESPKTLEEREQALLAREQALAARERQEALLNGLQARQLPKALSPFLSGMAEDGMAEDGLAESLDGLQSAWREAVSAAVRDRLRAAPPAASASRPDAPDEALRRLRAAMNLKP